MRNTYVCRIEILSETPQVQVPSTQLVVPSTPQIVPSPQIAPPMIESPVIQESVPPALNKFRQKKPKGKAKACALTAAELAERTAAARNTRKHRRGGMGVEEETQLTQEVIAVRKIL